MTTAKGTTAGAAQHQNTAQAAQHQSTAHAGQSHPATRFAAHTNFVGGHVGQTTRSTGKGKK
jgi:hypothetical protein